MDSIIKKPSLKHQYVKCEPGLNPTLLNQHLREINREVPEIYRSIFSMNLLAAATNDEDSNCDASIQKAIQENLLCLKSFKDGFFADKNRVRQIKAITG